MRIVEIDIVVGVWEDMDIIVVNTRQVKVIKQVESVLQVDIVVGHAMHDQKANILLECSHVGDSAIIVTGRVVLGGVHVAFGIDRVWHRQSTVYFRYLETSL